MRREASHSRTAALIALAAFAIHQLHFLFLSASPAGEELRREGYSYLGHVPLALAALAATVIVARLLIAYLGASGRGAGRRRSPLQGAALFAVAIFGVYVAQETVEALLFAQHAGGVLAALAHGWWLAVLLSIVLGPLFFALDRWMGRLEELVAEIGRPPVPAASAEARKASTSADARIWPSPLAFGLARRPPPASLLTS